MRLADGHIRVTADSIVFPKTCPRCGATPANTGVRLKGDGKGGRSIKIPYCKRCGWMLNFIEYSFAALLIGVILIVVPHFKVPIAGWTTKSSSTIAMFAVFFGAGWIFEQLFKLFFKPGVTVITWTRESIDVSFENQMYAEKFVELNR
jgi:hypothetical protein